MYWLLEAGRLCPVEGVIWVDRLFLDPFWINPYSHSPHSKGQNHGKNHVIVTDGVKWPVSRLSTG